MSIFDGMNRMDEALTACDRPIKCLYLGEKQLAYLAAEAARPSMTEGADGLCTMLGGIQVFQVKAESHYHAVYEQEPTA